MTLAQTAIHWFFKLLVNGTTAGLYTYYLSALQFRVSKRWLHLLSYLLLMIYLSLWAGPLGLGNIWYSFVPGIYLPIMLYILCTYKVNWREGLYHTLIIFFATDCFVRLSGALSTMLWGESFVHEGIIWPYRFLCWLLILLLGLPTVYLSRKYVFQDQRFPINKKQVLMLFLCASPLIYFLSTKNLLGIDRDNWPISIILIRVLISTVTLMALIGFKSLLCSQLQQKELLTMEHMIKSQYNQFVQKKESTELIMQKYHDLKHHIHLLSLNEDSELRRQYYEELKETILPYESIYQTGNETLDIILSEKRRICDREGIRLLCQLDGKLLNHLRPIDICTIFSNAMDNAIECVRNVQDESNRRILIKVGNKNHFLSILFENYYEHALIMKDGLPQTTKSNTDIHGYGLQSIRYSVSKNGGNVVVDTIDSRFTLTILLPIA